MSLDLSTDPDARPLAAIVAALQGVAAPLDIGFLIIGAAARDLMLRAHGLESPRQTRDVDFAFMVPSWAAFGALRDGLLGSGGFVAKDGPSLHRLMHAASGLPIDIVPFGGIENAGRIIAFPPDQAIEFDCFGVHEAYASKVEIQLPDGVAVQVAAIPAQVLLKIAAFNDRKHKLPGRDAPDLLLLIRKYLDCGGMDGLRGGDSGIFEVEDFDAEIASAQLLARAVRALVDAAGLARVLAILAPEIDPHGNLLLIRQSGMADDERALRALTALAKGLAA